MIVTINNEEIFVDDKLVHAYELAAGKFNDMVAGFLLEMDGIEVDKLTKHELEAELKNSMENEVKQMEYLSRPVVIEELIAFTRSINQDE